MPETQQQTQNSRKTRRSSMFKSPAQPQQSIIRSKELLLLHQLLLQLILSFRYRPCEDVWKTNEEKME
jgi:hypothetical protein